MNPDLKATATALGYKDQVGADPSTTRNANLPLVVGLSGIVAVAVEENDENELLRLRQQMESVQQVLQKQTEQQQHERKKRQDRRNKFKRTVVYSVSALLLVGSVAAMVYLFAGRQEAPAGQQDGQQESVVVSTPPTTTNLTVQETTTNTTETTTNTTTTTVAEYKRITTGTCASEGLTTIHDADVCEEAASRLGKTITWGPHGGYWDVVDGCSLRSESQLFLNEDGVCNTTQFVGGCQCTAQQPCLCKVMYKSITTGTCASEGLTNIHDADICEEAASRLGKTITWGPHGGYWDVVDGCSVRSENQLFLNKDGVCNTTQFVGGCQCTAQQPCLCEVM